ncbi:hypothetical protein BMS_0254 [Halobacteriovorax marinus SJ]|uniref:Uncharacterized protein n=1 Tax=Halobacteriovorax marinus (strain ATCC BAA-682 / DSM 15412 / SJ) TaxID=862908 RepID=E1X388_HALMS|nr:hypothetical protein [Halobacteriovorax marinus]CBW25183.1 hypothetical protein BMS_0254 [Halobacteriovorax marinus SJ]
MELGRFIFILLTLCLSTRAEITLPEIATKQATNNLRFISEDGKFSYYQRRSGSLLLSTNYNVEEVLKGKEGTQYSIRSSEAQKKQLIEQNESFHTYMSVRKLNKIYVAPYGGKKVKLIGEGVDSRLHLNDSWASFFNPYKSTLTFINLNSIATKFEINLQNSKNPYFIPQRVMLDEKRILFSNLNNSAVAGLIEFNRASGKSNLILKAENELNRYELCSAGDSIYLGTFGIRKDSQYSSITQYSRSNFQVSKGKILYDSKDNDRGSIICNASSELVYFIKSIKDGREVAHFEAASLNTTSKEVKVLSSFRAVSSLINMDGKLIIPQHGKFYLLNATKENNNNDSILNQSMKQDKQ